MMDSKLSALLNGSEETRQALVTFAAAARRGEKFRNATVTLACEDYDASDKSPEASIEFVGLIQEADEKFHRTLGDAFDPVMETTVGNMDTEAMIADLEALQARGEIDDIAALAINPRNGDLGYRRKDGSIGNIDEAPVEMLRVVGRLVQNSPEVLPPACENALEQINDALVELGEEPLPPIGDAEIDGFNFDDLPVAEKPDGNHEAFERYCAENEAKPAKRDFDGKVE